jgi:hypothetical protein
MGDSEDPVGRMLGVLRFWFTKDLVCSWRSVGEAHTDSFRNMSKASPANHIIPRWENSLEYAYQPCPTQKLTLV